MKMLKSELINCASEDENHGTEERETSVDEYLSDFTKPQLYMYEPCVSKESVTENWKEKEPSHLEEDASWIGNTLWSSGSKYKPLATGAESICC